MQKTARVIVPVSVVALLLLAFAPAASASTLTVDLNPSTGLAVMNSTSVTNIVLTYPANSSLSSFLSGYAYNNSASGTFPAGSQGVVSLEQHFHDDDGNDISVSNMTVAASYDAHANGTALVIQKQTTITATVSGVFSVVNGTVTANLGWRSFHIAGALNLPLEGRTLDVNLLGASVTSAMGGRGSGMEAITGMFAGASIWDQPTLNFSSLNSPLTAWTKNYDSVSNTTTFSKTVSGNFSLSSTVNDDGQSYSLKVTSDPSAVIAIQGYADASGNTLTIMPTPLYLSPLVWAEGAFAAGLAAFALVVIVRSRRRARLGIPSRVTAPL